MASMRPISVLFEKLFTLISKIFLLKTNNSYLLPSSLAEYFGGHEREYGQYEAEEDEDGGYLGQGSPNVAERPPNSSS